MQDRVPTYPGRVVLTPVSGAENTYDLVMADVPMEEGTPLNKATLLTDSVAALLGLGTDATPNDALAVLANKITSGTTDLTPGTSPLPDNMIYLMYE